MYFLITVDIYYTKMFYILFSNSFYYYLSVFIYIYLFIVKKKICILFITIKFSFKSFRHIKIVFFFLFKDTLISSFYMTNNFSMCVKMWTRLLLEPRSMVSIANALPIGLSEGCPSQHNIYSGNHLVI